MKKYKKRLISILLIIISIIWIAITTNAHSGRTDANGGHRDTKNVSGLGPYHYHCGGYPAHLHTNGVCPYNSKASSQPSQRTSKPKNKRTSTQKETSKSTRATEAQVNEPIPKQTNIAVTEVKINENIQNIKPGEIKQLTALITPHNATERGSSWKSSD